MVVSWVSHHGVITSKFSLVTGDCDPGCYGTWASFDGCYQDNKFTLLPLNQLPPSVNSTYVECTDKISSLIVTCSVFVSCKIQNIWPSINGQGKWHENLIKCQVIWVIESHNHQSHKLKCSDCLFLKVKQPAMNNISFVCFGYSVLTVLSKQYLR